MFILFYLCSLAVVCHFDHSLVAVVPYSLWEENCSLYWNLGEWENKAARAEKWCASIGLDGMASQTAWREENQCRGTVHALHADDARYHSWHTPLMLFRWKGTRNLDCVPFGGRGRESESESHSLESLYQVEPPMLS